MPNPIPPLVLAIDRDPAAARGLRLLLRAEGYPVAVHTDVGAAERALGALASIRSLIVDVGPGVGAAEEMARLRGLVGRDVPTLLLGHDTDSLERKDPGVAVLPKPVRPELILEWLARVLA